MHRRASVLSRETLNMAAALRLPKSTPAEERDAAVEGLIRKLGLTKVRRMPMGTARAPYRPWCDAQCRVSFRGGCADICPVSILLVLAYCDGYT